MMPNPEYIDGQTEVTWEMRETLVDWLLQVHLRYHMLPETLWIAINLVDRFLSRRVVSVAKLQLVGVTAMLVAAKYEEILAPSVDEFVFLCEGGYTREEILKGEAIVLQTLEFRVSQYCSPYSWMRKISKADDYDIQTRTLAKFTTELTLLDNRFLAVKPSLVAAVGMYTARRMLGGEWTDAFVFHSGYTAGSSRSCASTALSVPPSARSTRTRSSSRRARSLRSGPAPTPRPSSSCTRTVPKTMLFPPATAACTSSRRVRTTITPPAAPRWGPR
jgi:hypothetical protein